MDEAKLMQIFTRETLNETMSIISLYDLIFSLSSDNFSSVLDSIKNSIYFESSESVSLLARSILICIDYRIGMTDLYAKFSQEISRINEHTSQLQDTFIKYMMYKKDNEHKAIFRFIKECILINYINQDFVVSSIKAEYGKNGKNSLYWGMIFGYFGSEIAAVDQSFFEQIISDHNLENILYDDDFILTGYRKGSIEYMVVKNEIDNFLSTFWSLPGGFVDVEISHCIFQCYKEEQDIQFIQSLVCFYGRVNIFKAMCLKFKQFELLNFFSSLLTEAVVGGNFEIIRIIEQERLIKPRTDIAIPYDLAVKYHQNSILSFLKSHYPRENMNDGLFFNACMSGNIEIIIELLSQDSTVIGEEYMNSYPLIAATANNRYDAVKILLSCSLIEPNIKDSNGDSPLIIAAKNSNIEIVRLLIQHSLTNVNIANKFYQTPLHIAVRNGDLELVKMFVNTNGIELNFRDSQHQTPLHYAVSNGNRDVIYFLLSLRNIYIKAEDKRVRFILYHVSFFLITNLVIMLKL